MANAFQNFARITGQLIVGSQPQNAADIDALYDNETVRAIESLQESSEDLNNFNEVQDCRQKGIAYERVPVGFLHNGLQHFQITQMNHVKKLYYLKEIYSRIKNYQSSVV
jgi:hypothetical protein